jgi:hypothetical protein
MAAMLNFASKRAVAIGAAALVVAGGGGAAVAASSGSGSPSGFLDSVAKHLGVSREKLDDATKAAAVDQVNADLAAGRITDQQADELKKRIAAGDVPLLGGERGLRFGFGGGGPDGPAGIGGLLKPGIGNALEAAAKYLGLSESDLRGKLNDGQSLAEVAKAQNKDVDGLQQAILASAKSDLDAAVKDKRITQAQADRLHDGLKDRIDDIVNGEMRIHRVGRPFHAGLDAAASYLGLSESALREKLDDGQSLAQVAKAQSKDVEGLKQAIVDDTKADLDKAVADKKLTRSQADDILDRVKDHVDDLVNATPPERPRLREHHRGGAGAVPGGAGAVPFFGP